VTAVIAWERGVPVLGALAVRRCEVGHADWLQAAREAQASGGRLLSMWACEEPNDASRTRMCAAMLVPGGVLILELALAGDRAPYRGLQEIFPVAARLQRGCADLSGVRSNDIDQRPWLSHEVWPKGLRPLRSAPADSATAATSPYPFVRVDGDGVHEIAVGPIHAGVIEPGHFRFSVVGEKVLRLEERLGYVHKGIERRFTELPLVEGQRLAARISGDSAVAFSWAYCQAVEALCGAGTPPRGAALRGIALELERVANHLGDLGALGNDAGFAFGLSQFLRVKEDLLRASEAAFGQRYLFDLLRPGGTALDLTPRSALALGACCARVAVEARELREIYDAHTGLRDRFVGAGTLAPDLARRLGVLGVAGRASAQDFDARLAFPVAPYDSCPPRRVVHSHGDVAARVAIRFDELEDSCRLLAQLLGSLPPGAHEATLRLPPAAGAGYGLVEGWRGPVFIALEVSANGSIRRCHAHDPSWAAWPALEHAIIGNIVPDFPLINKSFNLSYSGHDL
jgi:Ni,Fe-hydrogenase III large subunit